ncbi:hypothetical protein SPI_03476 [Niveomyces insectorum RCEF 264]|uniref:Uncharacterized protein n=1 Tax=Niveomyces insectorum RCEF 264 TaxID=1081102 RepID=A0A167W401_9HYPO|nr:hypothetical protein SPI_03476 [Niveomyces insectorum RCEF 264]
MLKMQKSWTGTRLVTADENEMFVKESRKGKLTLSRSIVVLPLQGWTAFSTKEQTVTIKVQTHTLDAIRVTAIFDVTFQPDLDRRFAKTNPERGKFPALTDEQDPPKATAATATATATTATETAASTAAAAAKNDPTEGAKEEEEQTEDEMELLETDPLVRFIALLESGPPMSAQKSAGLTKEEARAALYAEHAKFLERFVTNMAEQHVSARYKNMTRLEVFEETSGVLVGASFAEKIRPDLLANGLRLVRHTPAWVECRINRKACAFHSRSKRSGHAGPSACSCVFECTTK